MILYCAQPSTADVAANGTEPEDVYPNTFWLPPTGMQRGSLLMTDGDPQTPNYPSIDGVYRTDIEELKKTVLPKIPCQPVNLSSFLTAISIKAIEF